VNRSAAWKVPYIDLGAQYQALKPQLDEAISRVMASGRYINGEETAKFENKMEIYLGVRHVIAVGNGYDALFLALYSLGDVGNVKTDKYTHISTHNAIQNAGYNVIFEFKSDICVPVHMNGRFNKAFDMNTKTIIEDACQAIGASYNGTKAGTFGIMGCFSLHPMKVLGCAGDGGFICTNDSDSAVMLKTLRNHGEMGVNSRLDNLQAAILNVKLPYLDSFIARRRDIARRYEAELPEWVKKPPAPSDGPYFDTYSSYVIGGSPELLAHLRAQGIECFSHIRTDVVSLPIYPEMKEGHIAMVCEAVRRFK
jgi:dTDP-4-amino-4,6-dideoxygalactose transaminase